MFFKGLHWSNFYLDILKPQLDSTFQREHFKNKPKTISIATLNAMNRSSLSEHLIKIPICGKNYNKTQFRLLRNCNNIFDLVKTEAIYIYLNKVM